ncbi:acetyl-CoA synthetase-like protein [Ramaria rubella]|nr:acetyl-CoA synthetase-like protein [Ramaria rubella]
MADLSINFLPQQNGPGLFGHIQYKSNPFLGRTVKSVARALEHIFETIIHNPTLKISSLIATSPDDLTKITHRNNDIQASVDKCSTRMGDLFCEVGAENSLECAGGDVSLQRPSKYDQLQYWSSQLKGATPLELPTDFARPETLSGQAGVVEFNIAESTVTVLRELVARHQTSLYVVLLAAFRATLFRATGEEDGVLGTVNANQTHPELEGLVGSFVTMHGIRLPVDNQTSYDDLIITTKRVSGEALQHGEIPFNQVVAHLAPHGNIARNVLARLLFIFQDFTHVGREMQMQSFGHSNWATEDLRSASTGVDLTIHLSLQHGGLRGHTMYQSDLFSESTVKTFTRVFEKVIMAAVHDPMLSLSKLRLATSDDIDRIRSWNNSVVDLSPPNASIGYRFHQVALKENSRLAVIDESISLSYLQLDDQSDRLAAWLIGKDLEKEAVVGIWMGRSALLVVAYLGCLKAGLAYMPLERKLPTERLQVMVQSADCRLVLSMGECPLSDFIECVDLAKRTEIIQTTQKVTLPAVQDSQISNVIFTSGSTGVPKGVMIEHRGMVNLCAPETTNWSGRLRTGLTIGIGFDPSGFQILTTLLGGSELYILQDNGIFDADEYRRFIIDNGLERLSMTPSVLVALLENGSDWLKKSSLKHLMLLGEPLQPSKIAECRRQLPQLEVSSSYGPTEASVRSAYFAIPPHYDSRNYRKIPLGRSLPNTKLYIVDESLYPVPPGVIGEIIVSGVNLARGYVNQPQITADRFLNLPEDHPVGSRVYLVGDLGYWTEDGLVQFVGRKDTQFKVRGQRMEAGEIELVINRHAAVESSAAAVVKSESAGEQLIAYIKLASHLPSDCGREEGGKGHYHGERSSFTSATSVAESVKEQLRRSLPEFMVPNRIIVVQYLPMNHSGKLDRRLLSSQEFLAHHTRNKSLGDIPSIPLNNTESEVLKIFSTALNCSPQAIDPEDNLFDIGGHSMTATRVMSRVRQRFGVSLDMVTFINNATVKAVALQLSQYDGDVRDNGNEIPRIDDAMMILPASDAQARIWVEEQMNPGLSRYNAGFQRKINGALNVEVLEKSFMELTKRHEVLRTTFHMRDAVLMQSVETTYPYPIRIIEISENDDGYEQEAQHILAEEKVRPFDLSKEIPIRLVVVHAPGNDVFYVSIIVHHIATDGWSSRIIDHELSVIYNSLMNGVPLTLEAQPLRYRDYSAWQSQRLANGDFDDQLRYWSSQLKGATPLELPTDFVRPEKLSGQAGEVEFNVAESTVTALRELAARHQTSLYVVLLAAFRATLFRATGEEDGVLGGVNANRTHPDLEGLVGFFVNTHGIRLPVDKQTSYDDLIVTTKRVSAEAIQHADIPFDRVVAHLAPDRDIARNALAQLLFVLQDFAHVGSGELMQSFGHSNWATEDLRSASTRVDLTIHLFLQHGGLRGHTMYQSDLFSESTVQTFTRIFEKVIVAAVHDPMLSLSKLRLTSSVDIDRISSWNKYEVDLSPPNASIGYRFHQVALKESTRLAVIDQSITLSYLQLDDQSDRLAAWLIGKDLAKEAVVGIWMGRSALLVVAYLGCLKAGLAYMPLERKLPPERLQVMVQSADCRLVLSMGECPLSDFIECVDLAKRTEIIQTTQKVALPVVQDSQISNVIFTSGSTGVPKGVMIEHRGMVNLCAPETTNWSGRLRTGLTIGIGFDPSGFQILTTLLGGSELYILQDNGIFDADEYRRFIITHGLERLSMTPSVLVALLENGSDWLKKSSLKHLMLLGEPLQPSKIAECRRQLPRLEVSSSYGPTEASVRSAYFAIPPHYDSRNYRKIPLGRSLPNTKLYIVDESLYPVPPGVIGEIVVSGVNLARGYVNQPQITADRFLNLPEDHPVGSRVYLVGDLGYWTEEGLVQFVGRKDTQFKVRGQRMEAGEIESVINRHAAVESSAAAVVKSESAGEQLIAYVKLASELPAASEREEGVLASWEEHYNREGSFGVLSDSIAGHDFARWNSMFTGKAIPTDDMLNWLQDTLTAVTPKPNDTVLELGVGTGQIALNLIDRVKSYFGTDLSALALRYLKRQAKLRGLESKLKLTLAAAHEFGDVPDTGFSLAIINSVVQYFPSADYLTRVIDGILQRMTSGGRIFLGDIRSYALICYHDLERALATVDETTTPEDIRQSLKSYANGQAELLLSPGFFFGLQKRFTSIAHVEIKPKVMNVRNELSRYRYSVVLHVSQQPAVITPPVWLDFSTLNCSVQDLSSVLHLDKNGIVGINNIPSLDIQSVDRAICLLEGGGGSEVTVRSLLAELEQDASSGASTPTLLTQVAQEAGRRLTMDYSIQGRSGNYVRAIFSRISSGDAEETIIGDFPAVGFIGPLHSTIAKLLPSGTSVADSLKEQLRRSLPDFMVPNQIVIVRQLPMNHSGKLDRKLLSTGSFLNACQPSTNLKKCEGPLTETERAVVAIFSRALDRPSNLIDPEESLFNFGGHSLMAMSVVAAIRHKFAVELSMAAFFRKPTVKNIAAIIDKQDRGSHNTTSLQALSNTMVLSEADRIDPIIFFFPETTGYASVYASALETIPNKVVAFGDEQWGQPLAANPASITSMARSYVRQIIELQPDGPFHLVGWSFGGYLAFETAMQLEALGKPVAMVLMIDTSIYNVRLQTSGWRAELDHLLSVVDNKSAWLAQLHRVNEMISNYKVQADGYKGRVVLIKALQKRLEGEQAPPEDPHNGWLKYLPQIDVRGFDATHRQMFDRENGPLIGRLISHIFNEAVKHGS